MIKKIYGRAFTVLSRKPLKLWGLSLLSVLLVFLANLMFGIIPGVGIAIGLLFDVALVMIFLRGYLGEEIRTLQLFDCFKDWKTIKRVLCGMGYMYLWVFLWSLIPVVGIVFAVIRSYEYRLTPYILMMEPDVPATEAYKVSKKRTEGFKAKMFWADLLWIVIVWVAFLILVLLAQIKYIGFIFGLVAFLLYLAFCLFAVLFAGLIQAAFYVEIQRNADEGPQFDDSMNDPPEKVKAVPAAPAAPAGEFKFCPQCGSKNAKESKFCTNCGYKFEMIPVENAAVEKTPAPEADAAASEGQDPEV
ncbi:MAG: zinc-ribbon domain-containing protein [Oscillospiraceae bacterium]|nr:zinc-ribbon domain-containing protein [Oscillospiraceae bacterium]